MSKKLEGEVKNKAIKDALVNYRMLIEGIGSFI